MFVESPAVKRMVSQLHGRVAKRFRLIETPVKLPADGANYRIYQPSAIDPLLDAVADDPEQNLPYWALIWPSGIALADTALAHRGELAGQRVLELGCGLGVTATAALAAGAELTVTDYSSDALMLCRLNALRNVGREPKTLQLNWREPTEALFTLARPPFPLVLAADVLYEARDIAPLLALVEQLVAQDGTLWLAEPRRLSAERFIAAATAAGWKDEVEQRHGPWSEAKDEGVIVNVHRLRRSD